jgi:hypothetical protein
LRAARMRRRRLTSGSRLRTVMLLMQSMIALQSLMSSGGGVCGFVLPSGDALGLLVPLPPRLQEGDAGACRQRAASSRCIGRSDPPARRGGRCVPRARLREVRFRREAVSRHSQHVRHA